MNEESGSFSSTLRMALFSVSEGERVRLSELVDAWAIWPSIINGWNLCTLKLSEWQVFQINKNAHVLHFTFTDQYNFSEL